MDIASLGFKIDSQPAVTAAQNLDSMGAAAMRMAQLFQQQQQQMDQAAKIMATYATATAQGGAATGGLTAEIFKQSQAMTQHAQSVGVMSDRINGLADATKRLREAQQTAFDGTLSQTVERNTAKIQELGTAFRDTARQMGVNAVELRAFNDYTAGLGLSASASTQALATLTKTLTDQSQATQSQRAVLSAYGVSLTDATGKAKGASDVMAELVKRMQQVSDGPQKNAALANFGLTSIDDLRALAEATVNQTKLTKDLQNAEDQRFANYAAWVKRGVKDGQDAAAERRKLEQQLADRQSTTTTAATIALGPIGYAAAAIGNTFAPEWTDKNIGKPLDDALNNVKKEYSEFTRDLSYIQLQTEEKLSQSAGGFLDNLKIRFMAFDTTLRDLSYRSTKLLFGEDFAQANQGGFFGTQYQRPSAPAGEEAPIPLSSFEDQQRTRLNLANRAIQIYGSADPAGALAANRIPDAIQAQIKSGQVTAGTADRATLTEQLAQSAELTAQYQAQTYALNQQADAQRRVLDAADKTQDVIAYQRAYAQAVEQTAKDYALLNQIVAKGSDGARDAAQAGIDAINATRAARAQAAADALVEQQTLAAGAEKRSNEVTLAAQKQKAALTGLSPSAYAREVAKIDARAAVDQTYSTKSDAERELLASDRSSIAVGGLRLGQQQAATSQMAGLGIQYRTAQSLISASSVSAQAEELARAFGTAQQSAYGNDAVSAKAVQELIEYTAAANRAAAANKELRLATENVEGMNRIGLAFADNTKSVAATTAQLEAYKAVRAGTIRPEDEAKAALTKLTEATVQYYQASAQQLAQMKDQNDVLGKTTGLRQGQAQAQAELYAEQQKADKAMLALREALNKANDQGQTELAKNLQEQIVGQEKINEGVKQETIARQMKNQAARDGQAILASTDSLEIAEKEMALVGQTVEVRQRELSVLRQIQQARGESPDGTVSSTRMDAIKRNSDAAALTAKAQEAQQTLDRMVTRFGDGTADAIVNAFSDGARRGESIWTSLVGSMKTILLRGLSEVLSAQVFQPLFRSAFSSISGMLTSSIGGGASGGATSSGGSGFSVPSLGGGGFGSSITNRIDALGNSWLGTSAPGAVGGWTVAGVGGPTAASLNAGTAFSSAGTLSSYLPFAGVGIGALTQFAQGNVGGGLGTLGGAGIGFLAGGPVGMGIGSALGGLIGGSLFGGKKPTVGPGGGAQFGADAAGNVVFGITSADNGYDPRSANQSAAQSVVDATKKLIERLGGTLTGTRREGWGASLGYDAGKKQFTGGSNDLDLKRFATIEEAMAEAVVGLVRNATTSGLSKDISGRLAKVGSQQDLEGLIQYVDQLKAVTDAFVNWKEPLTQTETAMAGLNAALAQAKAAADSLSQSTDAIQASYDKQKAFLTQQFVDPLRERELRATGQNAAADEMARAKAEADLRRDAAALGAEAVLQVEKTLAAERVADQMKSLAEQRAIIDQGIAARKQQLQASADVIGNVMGNIAAELDQALKAWRGVADEVTKFSQSLGLSALSPLAPEDQLGLAKSQYQDLLGKAMAGDLSAAQGVTGASQTYLEKAKNYYASSDGFISAFNNVQGDLSGLAGFAKGGAQTNLIDAYTSRLAGLREQQQGILKGFAGGGMVGAGETVRIHPDELLYTGPSGGPTRVFNPRETAAIMNGGGDQNIARLEAKLDQLTRVVAASGQVSAEIQSQMVEILDAIRRKANLAAADPMAKAA